MRLSKRFQLNQEQRNHAKRTGGNRFGATVVEFAIVTPLLLLFVLGLIEWGRFEMVRQVTSTAAFNAARRGTLPGGTAAESEQLAHDILEMYFVRGATAVATITPDDANVEISVPMSENSFVLTRFFGDSTLHRSFRLQAD